MAERLVFIPYSKIKKGSRVVVYGADGMTFQILEQNQVSKWMDVICFLDISQATRGHVLVVPKKHEQDIFSLSDKYAEEIMKAAVKVSNILREKLQIKDINLLNNSGSLAGQTVMHFHLHVLPRYVDDEINFHQVDHEPNFEKLDELYSILTK